MNKTAKISEIIRCIIIDDDPFIQDLLKDKITLHFPQISIVSICNNGQEGIERIQIEQPDLIFLDVEMGDMTGFEMLSRLTEIQFKVIFITSYKHYAIKAIRFNALDYLLKPFDLEELKNAIKRFQNGVKNNASANPIKVALLNLRSKKASDQILSLNTQQGELQLALKDIIHIEGERNYSFIHLTNKSKELVSKTLMDLEEMLDDKGFFRCHKSHLINGFHIINPPSKYKVELTDWKEIPIARRKKEGFMNWYHDLDKQHFNNNK